MKKLAFILLASAPCFGSQIFNPATPVGGTNAVQISTASGFTGSSNFTMNGSTVGINAAVDMQAHSIRNLGNGSLSQPALASQTHTNEGIVFENHSQSISFVTAGAEGPYINGSGQVISTNGTSANPGISFASDGGSGVYLPASDILGLVAGAWETERLSKGNSTDGVAQTTIATFQGGNGNNAKFKQQTTTGVTTSTSTINGIDEFAALVLVAGNDGLNYFADLLICGFGSSVTTITSKTIAGGPAARTYTADGVGNLKLQMASGTYAISSWSLQLKAR